jgi:hypothetical protein
VARSMTPTGFAVLAALSFTVIPLSPAFFGEQGDRTSVTCSRNTAVPRRSSHSKWRTAPCATPFRP